MDNEPDHSDVPDLDGEAEVELVSALQRAALRSDRQSWASTTSPCRSSSPCTTSSTAAVVVHYGKDVSQEAIDKLRDWYDDDPGGLIVARLPDLNKQIALTAWTTPDSAPGGEGGIRGRGYLAKCPAFDEAAFDRFVEEHRYKGPERVPPELMTPGT